MCEFLKVFPILNFSEFHLGNPPLKLVFPGHQRSLSPASLYFYQPTLRQNLAQFFLVAIQEMVVL